MKKITLTIIFLICFNAYSQVELITDFSWAFATKISNKIVFTRSTPEYGNELWVSDGTSEGTTLLRDIVPGSGSSTPFMLTLLDDVIYFTVNQHQIWRTNGTAGGTYMMTNNSAITNPNAFVKTKDFIFFITGATGNSCCKTLWRMNTSPNSENKVTPINNFITVEDLLVYDYDENVIFFNAQTTSNGWAIWRTNGGVSLMIKDLNSTSIQAKQMQSAKKIGSEVYFSGFTIDYGSELWKTDGTLPNTEIVKDIYVDANYYLGSLPSNFIKVGGIVYFTARDVSHGFELWKTDGTASGTKMVKDLYPGNNNTGGGPLYLTEFNDFLYFGQSDGTNFHIWKTDGTAEGTVKVINTPNTSLQSPLFVHNYNLYFSMETPETGVELWKIDSNENLTMVSDIAPGIASSYPSELWEFNGYIYFNATSNGLYTGSKAYRISSVNLSTAHSADPNFSLYPNPTKGQISIQAENATNYEIEVVDLLGKKVAQFENKNSIDISNLNSGIYIIKMTDLATHKTSTQKIIKE